MKRLFSVLAITCISAFSIAAQNGIDTTKLKLEQLTVVSRHNVRAPLQKNIDSTYNNIESKKLLMKSNVPGSHLTERGFLLEEIMGAYFRMWMKKEGLLKESKAAIKHKTGSYIIDAIDDVPNLSDYYFAASPRQRTVASTKAFASTFLPGIAVPIYHQEIDSKDPDFLPYFVDYGVGVKSGSFDTKAFINRAKTEVDSIIDLHIIILQEAYDTLQHVVNYQASINYKKGRKSLSTNNLKNEVDLCFINKNGIIKEPEATEKSHLKAANQLSDALILQFLEMARPDTTGLYIKNNSIHTWRTIADIKDIYSRILFTAPMVAVNTSHRLLCQVKVGIKNNKFTFLCTHDTSISAMLAALQANNYSLPESLTIEGLTPNGCKLCIEKYSLGKEYYGRVRLLYQSTEQVRKLTMLDYESTHPQSQVITFKGLKCVICNCNCDNDKGCSDKCKDCRGFYKWDDLMQRIDDTIAAFAKVAKGEKPF